MAAFIIDTAQLALDPVMLNDQAGYLTALTRAVPASLIGLIRRKLGDFPDMNRLIARVEGDPNQTGEEFSPEDYLLGITEAISGINTEEPVDIQFGPGGALSQLPLDLFMGYTVVQMLETAVYRRIKNEVTYSAQGISVDTQKGERYRALFESQRTYYRDKCRRYKKALNLQLAFGGLSSSYGWAYIMLR